MTKQKNIMWRFLLFAFKSYKPYFFLLIATSLVTALASIFGAYTISLVISSLERGVYEEALYLSLIIVGVEFILFTTKSLLSRKTETANDKMQQIVNQTLANKISSLPFNYLEDPYYIELKKNAQMGVNNMGAVQTFLQGILNIISNGITLITLGSIIMSFNWILVVALVVGFLACVLITLGSAKMQVKFFQELLPINFKYEYYLDTLYSVKNAKDFRYYSIYNTMDNNFVGFCSQVCSHFDKLMVKKGFLDSLLSNIQYLVLGFVYIIVGITTIRNHYSIANFSLIVSSAITFSTCVIEIIKNSTDFFRGIEYVRPIMEFMDIKEDKDEGSIKLDRIDSISFDHVTFTYPHTTKKVLDDVSFSINKDEKISIVGLNGAGKTTIVKLLCKLYKPDSGVIKINNINIYDYTYDSYMKMISTVFQDFKLFNYSILENISFDINKEDGLKLLDDVGLLKKINELPNGITSNIGKDYEKDGVELSGGQMQKIAIARALYKKADLLILDEPTSALDPLAEAEIYENFNSLAKDKMAIYISHRMSSSIFCDKILVLNSGKVEDFAPHSELMKNKNSLYYKLFMTQAENYKN